MTRKEMTDHVRVIVAQLEAFIEKLHPVETRHATFMELSVYLSKLSREEYGYATFYLGRRCNENQNLSSLLAAGLLSEVMVMLENRASPANDTKEVS